MSYVYVAEYRTRWFPFWRAIEINGHRYHPNKMLAECTAHEFTLQNERKTFEFRVRAVAANSVH
jgi:hypothetical protein